MLMSAGVRGRMARLIRCSSGGQHALHPHYNQRPPRRHRNTGRDHVWSYDFVHHRTHDGRAFRMLTLLDKYRRECLSIDVARRLTSEDVLERLNDLFVRRGVPDYIRSDNGAELTVRKVREWLERVGVKTLYIEPVGGEGAHRALAAGVQHDPSAQLSGVLPPGPESATDHANNSRDAKTALHGKRTRDRNYHSTGGTTTEGGSECRRYRQSR